MIKNDRLLRVLHGESITPPPIWLMRQAGRYLPEYRALRQKAGSFWGLCKTPEYAAEAALQPIRRYNLDAAILFSDILTIPDALGLPVTFVEHVGPILQQPIQNAADIDILSPHHAIDALQYVSQAIRQTKNQLDNRIPLIGFSGSPWTLMCYMVEGQSSKDWRRVRSFLYEQPQLAHRLLDVLTETIIAYLRMQIHAGADVLMLFDTWGSVLTPQMYRDTSLISMEKIVTTLKATPDTADTPIIVYAKGAHQHLFDIVNAGFSGIGLDWTADLRQARLQLGNRPIALQGNLDPAVLSCTPSVIQREVKRILSETENTPYIFNLGHGIPPDICPDAIETIIHTVRQYDNAL